MFNGWEITNILDVGLCELDTTESEIEEYGLYLELAKKLMK